MPANFQMSDGQHGMLRGQGAGDKRAPPPDAFQQVNPLMPKRSYLTDTEHERQAVGPRPQKTHANSTGFTSQCADLATGGIVEQAMQDKLNQTMAKGIKDGYNARIEEEDYHKSQVVTDEQIDAAQDGKTVDDDDLEVLRARRRQQMKEAEERRQKCAVLGHGTYDEIVEDEFFKTVTSSDLCVVHFYKLGFERCNIMDMHLSKCARKFFGTRFVKLNVEKAPWVVSKALPQTKSGVLPPLPCAAVFKDGVRVGLQCGFDGLPGDEFSTMQLAWRIKEWGGIEEDFGPEDEW